MRAMVVKMTMVRKLYDDDDDNYDDFDYIDTCYDDYGDDISGLRI